MGAREIVSRGVVGGDVAASGSKLPRLPLNVRVRDWLGLERNIVLVSA